MWEVYTLCYENLLNVLKNNINFKFLDAKYCSCYKTILRSYPLLLFQEYLLDMKIINLLLRFIMLLIIISCSIVFFEDTSGNTLVIY